MKQVTAFSRRGFFLCSRPDAGGWHCTPPPLGG